MNPTSTEFVAQKYYGGVASGYDAKRESQVKWHSENAIVANLLGDLPRGTTVLDIPVGTGRFIPLYREKGFVVTGMDISPDMLVEAEKKADETVKFGLGSVLQIPLPDKSVDIAVCIRLLHYLDAHDVQKALRELSRVTRNRILVNARVKDHRRAIPYALFHASLVGWRLVADEQIEDGTGTDNYRLMKWEPV